MEMEEIIIIPNSTLLFSSKYKDEALNLFFIERLYFRYEHKIWKRFCPSYAKKIVGANTILFV
jgi:hypothetical protein